VSSTSAKCLEFHFAQLSKEHFRNVLFGALT